MKPTRGFQKGTSGNPGGRPSIAKAWAAATAEVREGGLKVAEVSAKALALVFKIAMAGPQDAKDSNWTFAMTQVLHYSLGKPKEELEVTGDITPEAQALLAALRMTPHERRMAAQDTTADEDDAAMNALVEGEVIDVESRDAVDG